MTDNAIYVTTADDTVIDAYNSLQEYERTKSLVHLRNEMSENMRKLDARFDDLTDWEKSQYEAYKYFDSIYNLRLMEDELWA